MKKKWLITLMTCLCTTMIHADSPNSESTAEIADASEAIAAITLGAKAASAASQGSSSASTKDRKAMYFAAGAIALLVVSE